MGTLTIIIKTSKETHEFTLNDGETLDICPTDSERPYLQIHLQNEILTIKNDKLLEKEKQNGDS